MINTSKKSHEVSRADTLSRPYTACACLPPSLPRGSLTNGILVGLAILAGFMAQTWSRPEESRQRIWTLRPMTATLGPKLRPRNWPLRPVTLAHAGTHLHRLHQLIRPLTHVVLSGVDRGRTTLLPSNQPWEAKATVSRTPTLTHGCYHTTDHVDESESA